MKTWLLPALLTMNTLLATAQPMPTPPIAPKQARDVSMHGEHRIDDYFWLRERTDPRVLDYLKAENAYTAAWLAPRAAFKDKLYEEMLGRIKQDDQAVPYRKGRWWYSSRTLTGQQYPVQIRRAAQGPGRLYDEAGADQVLLDLNEMARGKPFLALRAMQVSPDARWLAFSTDETGGRDFVLQVKDLKSGTLLPWSLKDVEDFVWANDNRTLYYLSVDAAKRSNKLWRQVIGSARRAELVYEEKDELFGLGLAKTRDQRYLLLQIESKDTDEVRVIDADRSDANHAKPNRSDRAGAEPRVVLPRREGIKYTLDHRAGQFYVRINDTGRDYRLLRVGARRPSLDRATELIAQRPGVMLQAVDVFKRHLVVTERIQGLLQLRARDLTTGQEHQVAFDEPAYTAIGLDNFEADTTQFRFAYTSLVTPASVYDYDLVTRERRLRKVQPVLGGYEPSRYATERIMATASDGTRVPISLVYRRDLRKPGPQPLLLYGYGSYGLPADPRFMSQRLSLLDRGVVYAIAHVRGGGDLGRSWYEAAKMQTKATTFSDFIACADALVALGWTEPSQLVIQGASAGGLLMGAVVNARPELFKAVVAQVPFVDVINSMLDETMPLTVGEFLEWGNPKIAAQYAWMRAYSPYDNLKRGAYPAIFLKTGINDSQVAYWEPAKYVARLRTLKTDANPLLLQVNLEAGHGGASGRFDALKEQALEYTFMLDQWGLAR